MQDTVRFTINLDGNAYSGIAKLDDGLKQFNSTVKQTHSLMEGLRNLNNIFYAVEHTIGSVVNTMRTFEAANMQQVEGESRLAQVMRNTMDATDGQIDAIKELVSVQQQLGVVGDEVQMAGAQELGTYLSLDSSLQHLIPVMNDMIAQQYGYNATQESAVNIATMMGKVMEGQTGALSRYGYYFTEAQEAILKYGTEAEKAATLAEVIEASVGGMNRALAATPVGQMQQLTNSIGDVHEQIGALWVEMKASMMPAAEALVGKASALVSALPAVGERIQRIWQAMRDGLPIIAGLGTAITAVTVAINWQNIALNALIICETLAKTATTLWSGAQAVLNAVMTANPIGLVIAAVAALTGVIIYLCKHVTGLSDLWHATCNFLKYSFYAVVDGIKLYFDSYVNGFLLGLDKIKKGWYEFKEKCGMGDHAENVRMLKQINADVEARKKAIADGAKQVSDNASKAAHAFDGVSLGWKKSAKASEEQTSGTGINSSLMAAVTPNGGAVADGGMSAGGRSAAAVATGGTRNTEIHISIGDMIKEVVFQGSTGENKQEIERNFAECLSRVLGMAQASV